MNLNPGIIVLFIGVVIALYILISSVPRYKKVNNEIIKNSTESGQEVKNIKITKPEDEKNIRIGFGQSIKLGFGIGFGMTLWGIVLGILITIFFGSISALIFGSLLNKAF